MDLGIKFGQDLHGSIHVQIVSLRIHYLRAGNCGAQYFNSKGHQEMLDLQNGYNVTKQSTCLY